LLEGELVGTVAALTNQNWLITPAVNLPPATGVIGVSRSKLATIPGPPGLPGHPPPNPDQLWLLVLTGIASIGLAGNPDDITEWIGETVTIAPDLQAPLSSALGSVTLALLGFNLEMWAPFVAVSSVTAPDAYSVNAGFAVNGWRPTPFVPTLTDSNGNSVPQVFQGIDVDVSSLATSTLMTVSYNITLLGSIVTLGPPRVR
jgi:hypothetical protein